MAWSNAVGQNPGIEFIHGMANVDMSNVMRHDDGDNMVLPERDDFESDWAFYAAMEEYTAFQHAKDQERLTQGLDTHACMQFSKEVWVNQVCPFFTHDPSEYKPDYCVKVFGFDRNLLPVQGHAVYIGLYFLHSDRMCVFIAHIMGIGKTTIFICIIYVQHVMNLCWEDVFDNPDQHASKSGHTCPSNERVKKQYGFDCPCDKNSPTHFIKQRLGVASMLVPHGLLSTWQTEWKHCFPKSKNPLGMRLVVAHGKGGHAITKADLDIMQGTEERQWGPVDELGNQEARPSIVTPRVKNSRVLVITTSQSYVSQFLEKVEKKYTWSYQGPKYKTVRSGADHWATPHVVQRQSAPFLTVHVHTHGKDECHLEPTTAPTLAPSVFNDLLLRHKRDNVPRPALAGMSGTPLVNGPSDIGNYIEAMKQRLWAQDEVLQRFMKGELQGLGAAWTKYCKSKEPDEQVAQRILDKFTPLVEKLFIRWTTESDFLGEKPVKVPPITFETFECSHGNDWDKRVDELNIKDLEAQAEREQKAKMKWEKRHPGKQFPGLGVRLNTYYRARCCASLPGLMDLVDENGQPLKLTQEEWQYHLAGEIRDKDGNKVKEVELWVPETDSDPYYRNLKKIVESSGKIEQMGKLLDQYENFIDGEGKLSRHIWLSYFFSVSYVIYLWMKHFRKISDDDLIFVNQTMGDTEREREINRFHVDPDSKIPVAQQKTPRHLIATSHGVAQGLNLVEALSVTFFEVDYKRSTMIQGFGRHARQGNKNTGGVFGWLLCAKDNKVEQGITRVNNLRKVIEQAALRTSQDVEAAKLRRDKLRAEVTEAGNSGTVGMDTG